MLLITPNQCRKMGARVDGRSGVSPGSFLNFLCILLVIPVFLNGELKYNFSYSLKGATHGRILIVIPFRVHYQSSASVNFQAVKSGDSDLDFYFSEVLEMGYMMRTSGFSGRSLVILTAGYDPARTLEFSKKKMGEFMNTESYYSQFIKRKKAFHFQIFPNDPRSIRFKRDQCGQHRDAFHDFVVRFQHFPEILNIDFNIYAILVEMVKAYNHPFLPETEIEKIKKNPALEWVSPELDFSDNINRIVRLAARVMHRLKRFKQTKSFRLRYRILSQSPTLLVIGGNAEPDVLIWGDYAIKKLSRKVKLGKDDILLEDSLHMKIANPAGKGLETNISLKLID